MEIFLRRDDNNSTHKPGKNNGIVGYYYWMWTYREPLDTG